MKGRGTYKLPEPPHQHQNWGVAKAAKRKAMDREDKGSLHVLWMVLRDKTTVISSEHYNLSFKALQALRA